MTNSLAFDVYGTLIDTQGVVLNLQKMIGNEAREFSKTWRLKQLEYSFRRGLMQRYETFAVCIAQALDYTNASSKSKLTQGQKDELLALYQTLPAFNDVRGCLALLKSEGHHLYAFSNGSSDAIEGLLANAGIRDFFQDIVSVDDLKSFKPNPAVYGYFLEKTSSLCSNSWLISSNPFDVIGALSAGMKAAWVQRSTETIFDPWGMEPTLTVASLAALNTQLIF